MLRILHLSDFHFKRSRASQREMLKSLHRIIRDELQPSGIDMLLFSGDLVYSGSDDFGAAAQELFEPLLAEGIIQRKSDIFICAGNHDLERSSDLQVIDDHLREKVWNVDDLERFVREKNQFELSCAPLKPFRNFCTTFGLGLSEKEDHSSLLYSAHRRIYGGKSIGIVCLNAAWRSLKSKSDRGSLLYPGSALEESYEFVADCQVKILIMHHPLDFFREFNQRLIEDFIFPKYHCLFSGHIHRRRQSTIVTANEGLLVAAAPAVLAHEMEAQVGFGYYAFDSDDHVVVITNYFYDRHESAFFAHEATEVEIPTSQAKRKLTRLRQRIRSQYERVLERANDLLVPAEYSGPKAFIDMFVPPILQRQPGYALVRVTGDTPKIRDLPIEVTTIEDVKNNFMVSGSDKTGKTSLLYHLWLQYLQGYTRTGVLPVYLDLDYFYRNPFKQIDFAGVAHSEYGITRRQFGEFANAGRVRLLIDNFQDEYEKINEALSEALDVIPQATCVLCRREPLVPMNIVKKLGPLSFHVAYIHDLSHSQVRRLAEKWPELATERIDDVVRRVTALFRQLGISLNYWTLSLFLWIFTKTNSANFHNSFALLDLYIDRLLGKEELALQPKVAFSFENYKGFLADLAHFLLSKFREYTYSATYEDIVQFASDYVLENIRLVVDVRELLDHLLRRGLLYKNAEDRYTFRLRGVFEYFLALRMHSDASFLKEIMEGPQYLSFGNELELFSGLNRNNAEFLLEVYAHAAAANETLERKLGITGSPDAMLNASLEYLSEKTIAKLPDMSDSVRPLEAIERDAILEELEPAFTIQSSVQGKRSYAAEEIDATLLSEHIFILARVFRNADNIHYVELIDEVFDFIIDAACRNSYAFIREIPSDTKDMAIAKAFAGLVPVITHTFLYDAMAHPNMRRLIDARIDKYSKSPELHQYRLFVLYFLDIELDPSSHVGRIDSLLNVLDQRVLKLCVLVKLYFYLSFRSHGNPRFESELRRRIRSLHQDLNPNVDLAYIDKRLDDIHKLNLTHKAKAE